MSDVRHRTLILVEVLGERPWNGGLDALSGDTMGGDFSGSIITLDDSVISLPLAAQLLIAQGSDPEFLNICRVCLEEDSGDGEGEDGMCGNCADKQYAAENSEERA